MVIKQFGEAYNIKAGDYKVSSLVCQKQGNVDCAAYSLANVWCVLMGHDPCKVKFNEKKLRRELLLSFLAGKVLFSFHDCKHRGKATVYTYKKP